MQLSHTHRSLSASFDDPNLVSSAGLVPVMALAAKTGLSTLVDEWVKLPGYFGANAGIKVMALVAGMLTGGDSIDDMAVLRHGALRKLFTGTYAPSTLGSFLRAFLFGHVRQLDAAASRWLGNLAAVTPIVAGIDEYALVDIDDTIKEVHGHQKQGAGFGYSGVRGLNALFAIISTGLSAPIIVACRLRKGPTNSARGAAKFVSDTLATVKRLRNPTATGLLLLRADSAYYVSAVIMAAIRAGAMVSITARLNSLVKAAISAIPDTAWIPIKYTNAIFDDTTGQWISDAEVAEIAFTAFGSKKKSEQVTGRLVVRRIPELNKTVAAGQGTLFDLFRFHAFFTTSTLNTVDADKTHRQHAVIENLNADMKASALAHLPSVFTANAAWLVLACIAFNLTRAAGTLASPTLGKAVTATVRRKLINVAARVSTSARRITLHLPEHWPWEAGWTTLFTSACSPPGRAAT
ncbi:IS1380 family transposase [Cryobacterium psychrophilum]|uniref:IS1380 family transposase n=1 Tax=Cryobacterium psychrophilum TaxID=41988 RepID=A0A4Y8KJB9_9MICO|nr:IS1380 family transposase [Cryobacterium psychrophilum]TDW26915.1 DDE family transposase [Cryobacterium psychrophilum]TFD75322.1 IS1380 family transposase [Cryobacterium psychrophilum]